MLEKARTILQNHYGYDSFRKGQEEVIERILQREHAMGIMPTGGGKSICYQIPALMFPGITIVISPLISLMKDQVDELNEVGIPATYINSALEFDEVQQRLRAIRNGDIKLVYIAPERFESQMFMRALNHLSVSLVAIDEAHCLSQWGHDFRPSYLTIPHFIEQLSSPPVVLALTATATPQVTEDVCSSLNIPRENHIQTGFARENLSFHVLKGQDKEAYLLDYIEKNKDQSGIIYATTRKEVERLYEKLDEKGISVGKYHGGLTSIERAAAQEDFVYDKTPIMVATTAFGMGINKSNVRYVIHYQIPRNIETYYQEAGRAGRDGEKSECILLYSTQDIHIQHFLIEQSEMEEERKQKEYQKLQQMVNYCHTEECLQSYILSYFGDSDEHDCQRCTNCTDERETEDVTKDAQMVFSCIKRMKEQYGKTLVAQVLSGSSNQKIRVKRLDQLSTYGLMRTRTVNDISQLIDYFIAEQYIKASEGTYPVLTLQEKALPVLKGETTIRKKRAKKAKQIATYHPLFEALRTLRKKLADEAEVAPYMVFSDKTLNDLCTYLPETKSEMLTIKGIGQHKFDAYGEPFLQRIRQFKDGA
ncbi:DNA helicase RecQ [Texcoconibacillus texcoconensis]|uniref:DNA helicase RecQ n=1 Tax=Texcoconibacillus texcoconensis TaxID=1095777 RepID=A0A840QLT2_9BACI|nr:DNA helicase RecQ [Texcoconibacillus texcoconensis]MBB5172300.1 ATP-dependent DNA helicase RecQ [Texcoconibacillus texcoconensis]